MPKSFGLIILKNFTIGVAFIITGYCFAKENTQYWYLKNTIIGNPNI